MEEVMNFYENELEDIIADLNKKREKIINEIWKYRLKIFALSAPIPFLVLMHIPTGFIDGIFIVAIPIFITAYFSEKKMKKLKKKYVDEFKTRVISKLVEFVDESLDYQHNNYISKYEFDQSLLYEHRRRITRELKYKGEDFISGTICKTKIKFSEIIARYEIKTEGGTRYDTLLNGIFFIADFNKEFSSNLIVKNREKVKISEFVKNSLKYKYIELESSKFNEKFEVFGNDEVEARYILTPDLMEKISELDKIIMDRKNSSISLSFINSKLYIAVPFPKRLFHPKLTEGYVTRRQDILKYYNYITLMLDIVEVLDLNTRIWTKK